MTKAFRSAEGKQAVVDYYSMLLRHITVPYEQINLETRYGNTFLLAAGSRADPPVLLLHGSSMNSAMWIKDMGRISERYRVYAPDLPGEPGRSSEEQLPFDSADYANWLEDVLTALRINTVSLVGISLGAWVSVKFAIQYPGRVHKLALLCPAGIGGQNQAFREIAVSLLSKGEEGVDELFCMINGGNAIPEIMLNYQKLIAGVFHTRQEAVPMFTDEELTRLTMPSLLIVGQKDIMLNSRETARRMEKLVQSATIVLLPDAGHSLTGLSEEIMSFLTERRKPI